jgi:uncharacterized protein (DUF1501 family)
MTMPNLHASSRRELLLASGVLFAWAYLPKMARAEGRDPRLLVVVLRGALDGLATVAPVGDPDWVALRGDNVLRLDGPTPGLPLNDFFALNPAMPNLHRLYRAGEASIVHAVATPYRERSHFDGQDVLESGLAAPGTADTGWLNRALVAIEPGGRIANERDAGGGKAFAVGPIAPLVVRGPAPVLSWTPPRLEPATDDTLMRLAGRRSVEAKNNVAPQRYPIGVADRRHRGESVERAAQHDDQQARVAAFRARRPGAHARPPPWRCS